jgi:hypothetical protein
VPEALIDCRVQEFNRFVELYVRPVSGGLMV